MRKKLAHLLFHLLDCKILTGVFIYLVSELGTVVYHLLHRHVLSKLTVLVAVDAVIFVWRAIGIRTEHFVCKRHPATLTEFHFHCFFFLPNSPSEQIIISYIPKYKRAYRLLFFKCPGLDYANPTTKLRNYNEIITVGHGDLTKIWLRMISSCG